MTKRVYDVTASEMDWLRLTERMGTDMKKVDTANRPDPTTQLERDLRLSLYRDGFLYGIHESMDAKYKGPTMHSDADWAAGYSHGSTIGLQALSGYRNYLEGK